MSEVSFSISSPECFFLFFLLSSGRPESTPLTVRLQQAGDVPHPYGSCAPLPRHMPLNPPPAPGLDSLGCCPWHEHEDL